MRLALLTGGSRGIGCALAQKLVIDGFRVIDYSRTAPHLYSVATDFASPLSAHRTVSNVLASVDSNDLEDLVVVSNAATLEPIGPIAHKTPNATLENLNVNLASPILFLSAVVSHFQPTSCRKVIANISAGAAGRGVFGWSLYCAAKVGMENFIRTLAIEQEAQPHPFVPINIDPGVVDTHMHVVAAAAPLEEFPAANRFAYRRAQGQLTPPEQAADAITTLLLSSTLEAGHNYDARDVSA